MNEFGKIFPNYWNNGSKNIAFQVRLLWEGPQGKNGGWSEMNSVDAREEDTQEPAQAKQQCAPQLCRASHQHKCAARSHWTSGTSKWLRAAGTMPFEYKMSYIRAWSLLILIFWLSVLPEHSSCSHSWPNKIFHVKSDIDSWPLHPTQNIKLIIFQALIP